MTDRILVPMDGSPQSRRALEFAVEEWPDAALTVLHVIDPVEGGYGGGAAVSSGEQWYESRTERAEALFEEARTAVGRDVASLIEVGRPASVIVDVVDEEGFDLVVVGSHGRTGLSRMLLGSVAESVVRNSTTPVTVVRGAATDEDDAENERANGSERAAE